MGHSVLNGIPVQVAAVQLPATGRAAEVTPERERAGSVSP